jgi:hypothetical protein
MLVINFYVFVSVYGVAYVSSAGMMLPGDTFSNIDKAPLVRAPVLFIHGRRDEIVPFEHGVVCFFSKNFIISPVILVVFSPLLIIFTHIANDLDYPGLVAMLPNGRVTFVD